MYRRLLVTYQPPGNDITEQRGLSVVESEYSARVGLPSYTNNCENRELVTDESGAY